jgi:hypothetical protein
MAYIAWKACKNKELKKKRRDSGNNHLESRNYIK